MKKVLITLSCIGITPSVFAASFDCTKAHSQQEKMICGDAELSAYDSRMLPIYQKARKATGNSSFFRKNAKQALQWRIKHCKNKTCLMHWYEQREQELIKMTNDALNGNCLYEQKNVELTGKLIIKTYPGLPNFESIENGDTPMHMVTLQTTKLYCAVKEDEKLPGQTLFQLDNETQKQKNIRDYVGKKVTIRGTLADSLLGWEYTPLILHVEEIKSRK